MLNINQLQQALQMYIVQLTAAINTDLPALNVQEKPIVIDQLKNLIAQNQQQLNMGIDLIKKQEQMANTNKNNMQQGVQQQVNNKLQNEGIPVMNNTANNKKEIKAFNLKTAQTSTLQDPHTQPFQSDSFNDVPELGQDQFEGQQDLMNTNDVGMDNVGGEEPKLQRDAFADFLRGEEDQTSAENFVKIHLTDPIQQEEAIEMLKQFYMINNPDEQSKLAGQIYDMLPDDVKENPENSIMGVQKTVAEAEEIIKKLAKDIVKNKQASKKPFNLTKTAQHQTIHNTIMYGPEEKRIDPFSRQPVSDWHIMERNKGFGLVVDGIWDIDYEAIWRGAIMDKYSRPYRDKEGNWVGGYIQKRFEVDKNIPEMNNLQLKPGQRRRITPSHYGILESRLQASRSRGEIEGSQKEDRPFNLLKDTSENKKKS